LVLFDKKEAKSTTFLSLFVFKKKQLDTDRVV